MTNFKSTIVKLTKRKKSFTIPRAEFYSDEKINFHAAHRLRKIGLIITGFDYAYISVEKRLGGLFVSHTIVKDAEKATAKIAGKSGKIENNTFYLRVKVKEDSRGQFAFSTDGEKTLQASATRSRHEKADG